MLPTFLVIGAAKAGTSSICHNLGLHPDVFMSDPKEPHYFSRPPDSTVNDDWYRSLFENANGFIAVGEGSTSYTAPNRMRRAAKKIAVEIPHARLIYSVRNPVKRLESDWKMRFHEGWTSPSINEAVIDQPELINASLYWQNISVYREYFTDEQIKIVFLEDFALDPDFVISECLSHIGVDPARAKRVDLEGGKNDSSSFLTVNPMVRWLVKSNWWYGVRDRVPSNLKDRVRSLMTRKQKYVVEWDSVLLNAVTNELAEDARLFLDYCGKPEGYWDL